MKLTEDQVKLLMPNNDKWAEWVSPMHDLFNSYGIQSADRIAMFFAQCGHESLDFRVMEENLNYSSKALASVWRKYFNENTGRDPKDYHRQPERIANVIYANRMDNGDESSGDGWRFRGKGAIQVTGRYNTTKFAEAVGKSVDAANDYLLTIKGALQGALWYWDANNLNQLADDRDIRETTRVINGGYHGLDDRTNRYLRAQKILAGKEFIPELKVLLKLGSQGEEVKKVQWAVGVEPDGWFGQLTELAVIAWQGNNGLTPDGIVGPKTYKAMLGKSA
jgi:putative chitinase